MATRHEILLPSSPPPLTSHSRAPTISPTSPPPYIPHSITKHHVAKAKLPRSTTRKPSILERAIAMATSTAAAAVLSPPSASGLRLAPSPRSSAVSFRAATTTPARRSVAARAALEPSVVISLSTGLSLFLGRFVFFNFQRENVAKQVPEQNGKTHFDAGDQRAKEFAGILKSNDPVGFNVVDVLAWGSIGHIVAYYVLATASNGYDPSFFG